MKAFDRDAMRLAVAMYVSSLACPSFSIDGSIRGPSDKEKAL